MQSSLDLDGLGLPDADFEVRTASLLNGKHSLDQCWSNGFKTQLS